MGQSGKLQVAKDMAELQLCVGQHLFPLKQLVAPSRWADVDVLLWAMLWSWGPSM